MIGIVREFETPYHDIPGHFIGQCVLPVESIFLFFRVSVVQPEIQQVNMTPQSVEISCSGLAQRSGNMHKENRKCN